MTENPELNWAIDLGPIPEGDIELMEDAIEALESGHYVAIEHALHGLRKRVEAARSLAASPPLPQEQGAVPPKFLDQPEVQTAHYAVHGTRAHGNDFEFARLIQISFCEVNGIALAPPVADPRQADKGENQA